MATKTIKDLAQASQLFNTDCLVMDQPTVTPPSSSVPGATRKVTYAQLKADLIASLELNGWQDDAIQIETDRAKAAETALAGYISAEETRAKTAENTLDLNTKAETARAEKAEEDLATDLATEVTRASNVEITLANGLSGEITRASTAEQALAQELRTLQTGIDRGSVDNAFTSQGTVFSIATFAINAAGSGYAAEDIIYIRGVVQGRTPMLKVTSTGPGGIVTGLSIIDIGGAKSDFEAAGIATSTNKAGSGLTVDITTAQTPMTTLASVSNPIDNCFVFVLNDETHGGNTWKYAYLDIDSDGNYNWAPIAEMEEVPRDFIANPIEAAEIEPAAATDVAIGDRTIDDTLGENQTKTGKLTTLLSAIASNVKDWKSRIILTVRDMATAADNVYPSEKAVRTAIDSGINPFAAYVIDSDLAEDYRVIVTTPGARILEFPYIIAGATPAARKLSLGLSLLKLPNVLARLLVQTYAIGNDRVKLIVTPISILPVGSGIERLWVPTAQPGNYNQRSFENQFQFSTVIPKGVFPSEIAYDQDDWQTEFRWAVDKMTSWFFGVQQWADVPSSYRLLYVGWGPIVIGGTLYKNNQAANRFGIKNEGPNTIPGLQIAQHCLMWDGNTQYTTNASGLVNSNSEQASVSNLFVTTGMAMIRDFARIDFTSYFQENYNQGQEAYMTIEANGLRSSTQAYLSGKADIKMNGINDLFTKYNLFISHQSIINGDGGVQTNLIPILSEER
jgi:hypothetical protein